MKKLILSAVALIMAMSFANTVIAAGFSAAPVKMTKQLILADDPAPAPEPAPTPPPEPKPE